MDIIMFHSTTCNNVMTDYNRLDCMYQTSHHTLQCLQCPKSMIVNEEHNIMIDITNTKLIPKKHKNRDM